MLKARLYDFELKKKEQIYEQTYRTTSFLQTI